MAIPATANPNAAIYAFWDDLFVDAAASVRTDCSARRPTGGSWSSGGTSTSSATRRGAIDVNVVLHENGQIVTQTRNLADDGRERGDSATIGIENADGTVGIRFGFNQPVLRAEPAVNTIQYQPPA